MGHLTFTVKPNIPDRLKPLEEIARNLWISWNYEAITLFMRLDYEAWLASRQNPVRMLGLVPQEKLEQMARDDSFLAALDSVHASFRRYLDAERWYKGPAGRGDRLFLHGVRPRRGAARVLGRPRHALGRPHEDLLGPGAAAGGRRPPVPAGLLPAVPEHGRVPAGVLPRERLVQHARRPCAATRRARRSRVQVDLAGDPVDRPGLGGEGREELRCTSWTRTSRRTRPRRA